MKKISLFFLASVALTASSGAAVTITTAAGAGGADTFVQFGNPTGNFGGAADLTVKYGGNDTSTTNRKAYLRFDVSSLIGDVTAATLSLTVNLNNGGSTNTTPQNFTLNLYGLNDGSTAGGSFLGEDWDETAINWNNAPANITSGAGAGNAVQTGAGTTNGGQATLIGSFAVTQTDTAGDVVIAATGTSLIDFLNADTNGMVTFMITRTGWTSGGGSPAPSQGGSNLVFRSKESGVGADAPALELEVIPEPSAVLLGLVGLSVGLLRRQRHSF